MGRPHRETPAAADMQVQVAATEALAAMGGVTLVAEEEQVDMQVTAVTVVMQPETAALEQVVVAEEVDLTPMNADLAVAVA